MTLTGMVSFEDWGQNLDWTEWNREHRREVWIIFLKSIVFIFGGCMIWIFLKLYNVMIIYIYILQNNYQVNTSISSLVTILLCMCGENI